GVLPLWKCFHITETSRSISLARSKEMRAMSGDVINLRQARRARQRIAERVVADQNAIKHGLPKGVTRLADARREREARAIEGHRIDRGDARKE
ncbi:MAG: DUF4169 family protein, partial [Pseudomonadota bacterium]